MPKLYIQPNQTKTIKIPVIKSGGYQQATNFSVTGLPFGVSAQLNPSYTTGSGNLDLSVSLTAASYATLGNYTLVFSGNPAPTNVSTVDLEISQTNQTTTTQPVPIGWTWPYISGFNYNFDTINATTNQTITCTLSSSFLNTSFSAGETRSELPFTLNWGDGTVSDVMPGKNNTSTLSSTLSATFAHKYANPGTYIVNASYSAYSVDGINEVTSQPQTIPFSSDKVVAVPKSSIVIITIT